MSRHNSFGIKAVGLALILCFASAGLAATPTLPKWASSESVPELVISEVNLSEKIIWVELLSTKGRVDLSNYMLTDLDGEDEFLTLEPFFLNKGEYLVVRFDVGENETNERGDENKNGIREIFVGKELGTVPNQKLDQLVLIKKVVHGRKTIDAFAWAKPGETPKRWEIEDAAQIKNQNVWKGDYVTRKDAKDLETTLAGASFVRKRYSRKRNSSENWELSWIPTPGKPGTNGQLSNRLRIFITEVDPQGKALGRGTKNESLKKYAELLVEEGSFDLSRFSLHDMDGDPTRLARSKCSVKKGDRIVVWWSGRGVSEVDAKGDVNKDGVIDLYLPARSAPSGNSDQLVLSISGKVFDAVVWESSSGKSKKSQGFRSDNRVLKKRKAWLDKPLVLRRPENILFRSGNGDWKVGNVPSPGGAHSQEGRISRGSLILAEVFVTDPKSGIWAEVLVSKKEGGSINVGSLILSDMDGTDKPLSKNPITIRPGERFVVHWSSNASDITESDKKGDLNRNGYRDIYLSEVGPGAKDDQLVIYSGNEIIEALAWSNGDGEVSVSEENDYELLREGGWIDGDYGEEDLLVLPELKSGPSRPSLSRWGSTWNVDYLPTKGRSNSFYKKMPRGELQITRFQFAHSDGLTKDWAEIKAIKGSSDLRCYTITDLDGFDGPIATRKTVLKEGETARVHWSRGKTETDAVGDANANGRRDIYIRDEHPTRSNDQLVLYREGEMIDAVVYARSKETMVSYSELEDVLRIIEAGFWEDAISGRVIKNAIQSKGKVTSR